MLNSLKNLRNLIQINHPLFDLHRKCFIRMVKNVLGGLFSSLNFYTSLCWRWNLSWYSAKSLVTNIWCFGYSDFDSSKNEWWKMKYFVAFFSHYLMNQMFHHQRIQKQRISIKQIDVNMKNVLKQLLNKVGLRNQRLHLIFTLHNRPSISVKRILL
jgi:hypothetical protein